MLLYRLFSLFKLLIISLSVAHASFNIENDENIENFSNAGQTIKLFKTPILQNSLSSFRKNRSSNHIDDSALNIFEQKMKSVSFFQKKIAESFKNASTQSLMEIYNLFNEFTCDENLWEKIACELKFNKWPSQKTWKDAVGGHLFFPNLIFDYLENNYTQHFAKRSDILWACGLSGSFNHPLGLFYLAHILAILNPLDQHLSNQSGYGNCTNFCIKILTKSYIDLKVSIDNPLVFFSIGWGYMNMWNPHVSAEEIKDFGLLSIPNDPRCMLLSLRYKNHFKGIFQKDISNIDDYLSIGHQNYPSAYLAIASKGKKTPIQILENLLPTSYPYIYLKLAQFYKSSDFKKYALYMKEAIQKNCTKALILEGINIVGDLSRSFNDIELSSLVDVQIEKAMNLFQRAADLKDSEGFVYLGLLNQKMSLSKVSLDQGKLFYEKAINAYIEGCKLGNQEAYNLIFKLSSHQYKEVCDEIGKDPSGTLWLDFSELLKTI